MHKERPKSKKQRDEEARKQREREDAKKIEALNRTWREMGGEVADLLESDDYTTDYEEYEAR